MRPGRTTLHLLLLTFIIAVGLAIPAVSQPAFAAKAPAKPTNVKVKSVTDRSCVVSWKKAKAAKLYTVQYKKASAKKWKGHTTTTNDTSVMLEGLNADTKYQVRVRSINGSKKSGWTSAKSFTTKLQRPPAIWATYTDSDEIHIRWYPSSKAKKYNVICYQDNPDTVIWRKTVTGTTFEATTLQDSGGFGFLVQAVNGKKTSPNAYLFWGTYPEDDERIMRIDGYPTSTTCSLTRFKSGHDGLPGTEREIPALYTENYGAEGEVQEIGYWFPDVHVEKEVTLYYGTMAQAGASKEITGETSFKIGDSFTDLNGITSKITGLTIAMEPNIIFEDCDDPDEAFSKVDKFELRIDTDSGSQEPVSVKWVPWRPY